MHVSFYATRRTITEFITKNVISGSLPIRGNNINARTLERVVERYFNGRRDLRYIAKNNFYEYYFRGNILYVSGRVPR